MIIRKSEREIDKIAAAGDLVAQSLPAATREPTVEVAHEALLREWPRLRGWIDQDRGAILAMAQLRDAAKSWAELDRDPGALYRGARLATAVEYQQNAHPDLTAVEEAFLDAGAGQCGFCTPGLVGAPADLPARAEDERPHPGARTVRPARSRPAAGG